MSETESPLESVRLDVWLDVACLFKTRSQAQSACKAGKVELGGARVKPHRQVRIGDRIVLTRTGFKQEIEVAGLAEKHIARVEAKQLWIDHTPEPTAEELVTRRFLRLGSEKRERGAGSPKKRERRELRRLKGRD